MTDIENPTPEPSKQPPVLYERLVPLMTDLHKDLKLVDQQDFSFAAKVNAVPVVMQELPLAGRHYPIVFAADAPGVMLAVLGIKNGENLFVDDKGKWREDCYIPAYVRRYPFFIARPDEKSEPVICFDDTSSILSPDGNRELFEDGKATDHLNRVVDFTRGFQQNLEATNAFGRKIEEMELLEEQTVSFTVDKEVKANVNGFKTVNRTKFDELDGDTLKEWLGKGWIDSTVLHLASGANFDRLWKMAQERDGSQA